MPNFLCLQRSLPSGDTEKPSPADMQEMYAKFGAWQQTLAVITEYPKILPIEIFDTSPQAIRIIFAIGAMTAPVTVIKFCVDPEPRGYVGEIGLHALYPADKIHFYV